LGKIIGGGFPIGAFGGRRDIMEMLAPAGPVYQAGTLSGNPVACAAGLEMLSLLKSENPYPELERRGAARAAGLAEAAAKAGVPATVNRVGSMMTLFFTATPVTDYATAATSDTGRYATFFRELLARGVYFPPSQFEAVFVSAAHSDGDIASICEAARSAMRASGG
jgi:glutamate-1-semialdehyde 2,1-aminomutase